MAIAQYQVSASGRMTLPAETRRHWRIADGGAVEIADLGAALVVVPAGRGGLRAMLSEAIEEAGGYQSLAHRVAASEPDLA